MKDSYKKIFRDVQKILIIMAHPDDAEITCGGLMSRLIEDQKEIRLVITTDGEKGSKAKNLNAKKLAKIRASEQIEAAKIIRLNSNDIYYLGYKDGEIEYTYNAVGKLVFHIRDFKPDLIITHNPQDYFIKFSESVSWVNHHDHRVTAQLSLDAAYPYSRDTNFFPEQLKTLSVHAVHKLLITDSYQKSRRIYVEYTGFQNQKLNMLKAHKSQIEDPQIYLDDDLIQNKYLEIFEYLEIY